jgi:signal transduction histidine kinase/putative methionine-R-sulfoxide reductase with GAF domain
MQCPRCQHENPAGQKFCGACGTSLAGLSQSGPPPASYADLQREVEHLTRALSESLEQQTATSEILRVISSSPTDVQPVLEAVAETAARLCEAPDVSIFVQEADHLRVAARHGPIPSDTALPLSRETGVGEAVLGGRTVHVADMQTELDRFPLSVQNARRLGFRTVLNVPLIREGVAIGAISLRRTEARPFAERQVALLQTFADQAVIAIENVRLFKELQASNRDLTEALEQQTATSEILRVISSSPTDIQPVFDVIVEQACRLCDAVVANAVRIDGDLMHNMAAFGFTPEAQAVVRRSFPMLPSRATMSGRAILERAVVASEDASIDEVGMTSQEISRSLGGRAMVSVPMLRDGIAVGAITLARRERGRFPERQVNLLRSFAHQAVIALENVRLFTELQEKNRELTQAHRQVTEALEQQTATGEILRIIAGSPTDLQPVLDALVESAGRLCEAADTFLLLVEGDQLRVAALHPSVEGGVVSNPIQTGWVAGRAVAEVRMVHVEDLANAQSEFPLGWEIAARLGHRTVVATPLVRKGVPLGALFLRRRQVRPFSDKEIALLQTFADQAVIAIENVRLFHEIAHKNRQLEAASHHKSEFLANMSHELRTPLNAVIGFSEVLLQRMFGDLNAKQDEYLKDVYASGQHLLSLINDILDLSKIEAGRMELAAAPFRLPTALENAVTLVKERATRHGITLELSLDPRLDELMGDERKVKQVLLNLLSNAVKFTPEGGRISVKAGLTDGAVEISVTDSGIGIAPEDQAAIFEEFRQVGSDDARKQEGTGLGLTLARKFVELHGGRIWVESEVGRGSTFTFTLPVG